MKKANQKQHREGCVFCGKPLVYTEESQTRTCDVCGKAFSVNVACEDGHYICDTCHASGNFEILTRLKRATEQNPLLLFERIVALPSVHMHGPEHHPIVAGTLLVAYKNNGGEIDLDKGLDEAFKRGQKLPGGVCGSWGCCGAAVGAGIYASVLLASTPMACEPWGTAQNLTARCLSNIAEIGGPRCCKRTSRIAIETAVTFTKETTGIDIPTTSVPCVYDKINKQCINERCPYYRSQMINEQD